VILQNVLIPLGTPPQSLLFGNEKWQRPLDLSQLQVIIKMIKCTVIHLLAMVFYSNPPKVDSIIVIIVISSGLVYTLSWHTRPGKQFRFPIRPFNTKYINSMRRMQLMQQYFNQ